VKALPERVRARAPAKINLELALLGKRPDGYHEVDTLLLALDLADELELERSRAPGVQVELAGPCASADIPADGTNLAARAAQGVLELAGRNDGIVLRLVKNIPSGAGLGGGSADAAAAWIAAATLCGLDPRSPVAEAQLAALGSDCVFFWKAADTGFARCQGRGERVEPRALPAQPRCVALIVPDVACPTALVYAAFRGGSAGGNDLEPAALEAVPELREWRKTLDSCAGTRWRLSGSGSAFFAPHGAPDAARAQLERVRAALAQRALVPRGSWVALASGRGAEILPLG
jgi:4-diphosphocytidyl-2-C-methyl-D-erythritol kinase